MRKNVKWTMLRIYLITILVLVLAGNAVAYDISWIKGASGPNDWNTPASWDTGLVPVASQQAVIDIVDANCNIKDGNVAVCYALDVAPDKGPCRLNVSGGTLATNGVISIGGGGGAGQGSEGGNGYFTMTGGTVNSGGRLWIGYGNKFAGTKTSNGSFIMRGGEFNVAGDKLEMGKNPEGVAYMEISDGNLNIKGDSGDFEIGKYGRATVVITGGEANTVDDVKLGGEDKGDWSGVSHMDLFGGLLRCDNLWMGTGGTLDITEGKVRNDGGNADLARVRGYIGDGIITSYGGDGIVDTIVTDGVLWVTARPPDPCLAYGPNPRNNATVQWSTAGPTLAWKPAKDLISPTLDHDVYFGTNFNDVNDANRDNEHGVLVQKDCETNSLAFPAAPPELDETYYWRVDENDEPNSRIWRGYLWQFKIANYVGIENFNSYADTPALKKVWSFTGSDISLGSDPYPVHLNSGSGHSMRYDYTNNDTPYHTEANAVTGTGLNSLQSIQDWAEPYKALTLYFYGSADNNSVDNKMYVALRSADGNLAVVYYGADANDDPNNLKIPAWHEWNIKLSDFSVPGTNEVNLHSIAQVYIGFGDRETPVKGDIGHVYFDDIRLYPSRCVPSHLPPGFGDTDSNCVVDIRDVNAMIADVNWLTRDSTTDGNDGNLTKFPDNNSQWINDPTRGQCLAFDGNQNWLDFDDSDFHDFRNKTIAFWVRVKAFPSPYVYLFHFSDGVTANPYRIYIMTYSTASPYYVRARFMNDYSTPFAIGGLNLWAHLAFVVADTPEGAKATFYGYYNSVGGALPDPGTGPLIGPRHSGRADEVSLGSAHGVVNNVNADFDDFRVYDYNLSPLEVQYLATDGAAGDLPDNTKLLLHYTFDEGATGGGHFAHNSSNYAFYHPLFTGAELYKSEPQGQRVVNLRDFAVLARTWLQEQLWP